MSSINVNTIKSRLGGPPTLPSGVVVSAAATFNNDVSIGGTLTYEDVTSVDVVGLITARSGIEFGAAGIGGTIAANGNTTLAGVVTATTFSGALSGNATSATSATSATTAGTVTTGAQPNITSVGTLTNLVATASSVTGISSVGLAITMYGSSGIVSATAFYGDGSQLEGVSASGGGDIDITSCLFI